MNTPQRLGCVVLGCLDCQAVVLDLGRLTSLDTLTLQRLVAGAAYLFAGCMYNERTCVLVPLARQHVVYPLGWVGQQTMLCTALRAKMCLMHSILASIAACFF